MKTLKQIMIESDYTDPKAPADKAFVDKHVIQKTDYPHKPKDGSNDDIFSGKKQKRKKKKTDHEDEKAVYEMSELEKKKKEDIVKGMKKNTSDFISRYGKDGESVMHATATKLAQEEDEGWHAHNEIHGNKGVSKSDWKKGVRMNRQGEKVPPTVKSEESNTWDIEANDNDIAALKGLHETLNDANKEQFEQQIKTPEGLKKMIEFANNFTGE
jgi:hypothetical protein